MLKMIFFQRRRIKAEWVPLSHGTEMHGWTVFCQKKAKEASV